MRRMRSRRSGSTPPTSILCSRRSPSCSAGSLASGRATSSIRSAPVMSTTTVTARANTRSWRPRAPDDARPGWRPRSVVEVTRFGTIAHPGRVPHARVLAGGLAEHHPGARLTVLFTGPRDVVEGEDVFDILRPEELGVSGWEGLLQARRWPELEEFLKPHLLSRLIGEGADPAIYLDATVDIHAPLEPVMRELER